MRAVVKKKVMVVVEQGNDGVNDSELNSPQLRGSASGKKGCGQCCC